MHAYVLWTANADAAPPASGELALSVIDESAGVQSYALPLPDGVEPDAFRAGLAADVVGDELVATWVAASGTPYLSSWTIR